MPQLLPFFDLESSASYLADLLDGVEPPFDSVAVSGHHSETLANKLRARSFRVVTGVSPADVIVSWDEIHLLKASERSAHVSRLADLVRRELIIACPLGTDLQLTIYRSLAKLAQDLREEVPSEIALALQYGLPDPVNAASWAHGFLDIDLFYAGDVLYYHEQATRHLYMAQMSTLRKVMLKFSVPHAHSVSEEPLPPETVPMRRHRRLFLLIRKR